MRRRDFLLSTAALALVGMSDRQTAADSYWGSIATHGDGKPVTVNFGPADLAGTSWQGASPELASFLWQNGLKPVQGSQTAAVKRWQYGTQASKT